MKKIKPKFLTIEEIQERMRNRQYMPTAVFAARKRDYIVKPRGTIFGLEKKKSKGKIKW